VKRSTSILLLVSLLMLALPAASDAAPLASLRNATLRAASGNLTISETRCPPGSSSNCGTARLEETFQSGTRPKTRATIGRAGFRAGLRILGKGSGACSAESPSSFVTGPDGSSQFLGGAQRLEPGAFIATRIAMAGNRRGARVAWLEPLLPSIDCDFFDQPGTSLALPAGQALQAALMSPTITPGMLRRSRFAITIAGSQEWTQTAGDGTRVDGHASWNLRLDYATTRRSAKGFVGSARS